MSPRRHRRRHRRCRGPLLLLLLSKGLNLHIPHQILGALGHIVDLDLTEHLANLVEVDRGADPGGHHVRVGGCEC